MIFKRLQQTNKMLSAIVIVAILLFAPLAKSTHLAEHDFSIDDVHCHICLAKVMDDDDYINSDGIRIENHYFSQVYFQSYSLLLKVKSRLYSPRAPPKFL
ncbi:hypothetical protein RI844_17630 [Thalassotalea fonticola]|uniref:Uncharacterized protein n=1 Tax=Thalassotalea fonticola TaxID=3065649 RepID=A0ABZ0GMQ0_9GAMM|nr:hypothetical protein RI844_17630 [Colwelliaceae bacterium S1-1]